MYSWSLAENQIVKHDTESILKTFKSFYLNPAQDLLAKLLKSPNQYAIKFVSDYYEKLSLSENFELVPITEGYMFNILKMSRSQKQQELIKFQENF